jgi:uncharacterized protein (TIGR02266 family)
MMRRLFVKRAARTPIDLLVRLTGAPGEAVEARGEDLSTSGLFVRCEEPYTVGTPLQLQLELPTGPVHGVGKVVRVGAGASGHVGMGILFTVLDGASRAAVARLVAQGGG